MKIYTRNFTKTIYGFASVEANSIDEANERFESEDFDDEHDNKSEYDWTSKTTEE